MINLKNHTGKLRLRYITIFKCMWGKIKLISLERRLFVCFFLISIIPTIFMGLVSYNRAYCSLEDKISRSSQQVVNQTVSNLDYILKEYDDNLKQVYTSEIFQSEIKTIIDSEDELKRLIAIKNINKILRSHLNSKNNIYGIAVMFDGQDLCLESGKYFIDIDYKKSPVYINTLKSSDNVWMGIVNYKSILKDISSKGNGIISLSRNIISTASLKKIGIMAMAIREELLLDVISPIELEKDSAIFILDENNDIVSSRRNGISDELLFNREFIKSIGKETDDKGQEYFTMKHNNDKFLINYGLISENDWKIVSLIPYRHIMEQAEDIKRYTFYVLILCIVLSIVISKMLSTILVRPLKKLELSMKQIQNGNFGETVPFSKCQEFMEIEKRFNRMSERLEDLMNEIKVKEKEKAEAEFKFLQSQINPHFLYNTLDSIKGMIICDKNDKALLSLEKLSEFFKTVLKQSGKEIPLVEEIKHVENYLTIQKLRNVNKINYSIDVDERIEHIDILRFILQPIIENAISHGIRQKRGMGLVTVSCNLQYEDVIIEIKDTGVGIDAETLECMNRRLDECKNDETKSGEGIGIINVNRRIKLFYGMDYGLRYESIKGEWTKAIIKIPYRICGRRED